MATRIMKSEHAITYIRTEYIHSNICEIFFLLFSGVIKSEFGKNCDELGPLNESLD